MPRGQLSRHRGPVAPLAIRLLNLRHAPLRAWSSSCSYAIVHAHLGEADMLVSDQIQRELAAIEDFDSIFLTSDKRHKDEVIGFLFRQLRKQELLRLEELIVSRK